jgi:hypothetical protein
MGLRRIILTGAIIALTTFSGGCNQTEENNAKRKAAEEKLAEHNTPVYVTVLEEEYFGRGLREVDSRSSSGLVSRSYSNETIAAGDSIYLVKGTRSDTGKDFVLDIKDSDDISKEALDCLVSPGDVLEVNSSNYVRINRTTNALVQDYTQTDIKDDTQIAVKDVDAIRVLGPEESPIE